MSRATEQDWNYNPEGSGGFKDHPENINVGGRPKNSLKSYVAKKLAEMPEEEKDEFLKKITPETQWKMGEGNPHQSSENKHEVDVKPILVKFIDGNEDNKNTS